MYFLPQGISADLIATKYGFSRDDVEGAFFGDYMDAGVFGVSPFETIDVNGVGRVVEIGRKDVVGRPALFGTTDKFLRQFGIHAVEEMPDFSRYSQELVSEGEEGAAAEE